MKNAIDRVKQARSLPEIAELQAQLQQANLKITRLEKELAGMSQALKKHLRQPHQNQEKPGVTGILGKLFHAGRDRK